MGMGVKGSPTRRLGITAFAAALVAFGLVASSALAVLGSLTVVETESDGAGGVVMDAPDGVVLSPDGTSVYVADQASDGVTVFSRNPSTGTMAFVEFEGNVQGSNELDQPFDVAVSPDGQYVYANSFAKSALVTFTRDMGTGALAFHDIEKDGVGAVTTLGGANGVGVSPDNQTVYVASATDDTLTAFQRNLNGTLDVLDSEQDGVSGVDGLDAAHDVKVAPDGENVYTTAAGTDNAVTTFDRAGNGTVAFNETDEDTGATFFGNPIGLDVSDDNANVYVAGQADAAVTVFTRAGNGDLAVLEEERDGLGAPVADGLSGAWNVDVGAEGRSVYVAANGEAEVSTFDRNPATGALSFVEVDAVGTGPAGLAASEDSRHVYVSSFNVDQLRAFSRELLAPADTAAPAVTGAAEKGSTLTCSNGTWVGVPTPAFTREWLRGGVPIAAQTGTTYITSQADVGAAVSCRITATNVAGMDTATSNAVNVVDTAAPPLALTPPSTKPKLTTAGIEFTVGCGGEACTATVNAALLLPKAKKKKAGKSGPTQLRTVNLNPVAVTIPAGSPPVKDKITITKAVIVQAQRAVYRTTTRPNQTASVAKKKVTTVPGPTKSAPVTVTTTAADTSGNTTTSTQTIQVTVPKPVVSRPKQGKTPGGTA
jgi:6-phosphogluconolactonase (cycloisomerase 2 family)